jgi:predicted alpha/beta hydrolase family esterase
MKQVILIHGLPDDNEFDDPLIPSPSNSQWFPWVQKQLAMQGEVCQSLEFPFRNHEPVYSAWLNVIENFKIDSNTTLVGHSCGGGFLLRYLSEYPDLKPKRVILVAPWIDPQKELSTHFFDFNIDETLNERTDVCMFASADDMESVLISIKRIKEKLPTITCHEFTNKGHFCTPQFPELLELLK